MTQSQRGELNKWDNHHHQLKKYDNNNNNNNNSNNNSNNKAFGFLPKTPFSDVPKTAAYDQNYY